MNLLIVLVVVVVVVVEVEVNGWSGSYVVYFCLYLINILIIYKYCIYIYFKIKFNGNKTELNRREI
jgi:hypothetical protein